MSTTSYLLAATVSVLFAWAFHTGFTVYRKRKWFRNLPGPPHSWILGHLKAMGEVAQQFPPNNHPQSYLTELQRKHDLPAVFYMDLWPAADPMVVITDIDVMNYVHVLKPLAIHSSADDFLAPMIGHNVVAVANGPTWKMLHNAMAPSFSAGHVKNMSGVIVEECLTFRETLAKLADRGEVFDMEKKASELIFDVIARLVFNFPLRAQIQGSQVLDDLKEMIALAEATLGLNPIAKLKVWWRRSTLLKRLHREILGKIYERYELLKSEKVVPSRKDPYSTLDLMLREQLMQQEEVEGSRQSLDPVYEGLLLTNIKGLLVGGQGTTTDTLCFCYMLLSNNPEAVQKLREEHSRVFDPDFEKTLEILKENPHKLNELDYTTGVIKETLRLFPVGFGVRVAQPGATVQFKGKTYPIDNNICVVGLSHAVHYNEAIFPSPTKFIPERFMDPDTVPRAAFRSFSRGPRACLGQNLAIDELRTILLMTIRDFDFEFAGGKPRDRPAASWTDLDTVYGDVIHQEMGLEAKPRGGMPIRVKRVIS